VLVPVGLEPRLSAVGALIDIAALAGLANEHTQNATSAADATTVHRARMVSLYATEWVIVPEYEPTTAADGMLISTVGSRRSCCCRRPKRPRTPCGWHEGDLVGDERLAAVKVPTPVDVVAAPDQ